MKKPVAYLETSFVSCLTGWWSPLEHVRARQAASRAWWAARKDAVQPVVSFLVWKETGYRCPAIATPQQLLERWEDWP